jgi:hypothetical protein
MTAESDWEALRARLMQLREAVAAEIRACPVPIPACDAQYDHLLERRSCARTVSPIALRRGASGSPE